MKDRKNGSIKMKISTFLTIIFLVSSIVATYYIGLARAKDHTKEEIEKVRVESRKERKEIKEKLSSIDTNVAVIMNTLKGLERRR